MLVGVVVTGYLVPSQKKENPTDRKTKWRVKIRILKPQFANSERFEKSDQTEFANCSGNKYNCQ